jgi:hypothetical protein
MFAPSQTCHSPNNAKKADIGNEIIGKVAWYTTGKGICELPFGYTIFTKDVFAAQKDGNMHLFLAYRTQISSSNHLDTEHKDVF